MSTREILVANTKTQKRSKITSSAMTLGELKRDLLDAGIDYSGMTFTEGISKTQLLEDGTQLPQNVMYKGQPTNNLVILLTNTKKNIASGSDRQAAYEAIKSNCLQDAVKEHFGRNFTQVSTDDLWNFIRGNVNKPIQEAEEDSFDDMQMGNDYDEDAEALGTKKDIDKQTIIEAIKGCVNYLYNMNVLNSEDLGVLASEFSQIAGNKVAVAIKSKPVETSDGSITDDDIDDMISSLNV